MLQMRATLAFLGQTLTYNTSCQRRQK
ncbi:hypothetical protein WN66_05995 [Saccharomyces cerevisiae]|uniref:Putative uncharacterized protein YOR161W-A n=2 Tax=Saccharomyces cerevisiae TaxID=4932 RepID=YO61A_YEAST|nr:RecName: Full=Putative uncharacterized protein YOR161W-A [Saccharomyces cerevisiae S288C]AAL79290.1 unknown [Saccharomyces cerevisiae]KZV08049.1 hypothetical protein WN66_05995 [Saccharomyces cerevisiae]CAY86449.1 EC1118_1O4_3774p [Saccharomyces cerevisiae EC1118]